MVLSKPECASTGRTRRSEHGQAPLSTILRRGQETPKNSGRARAAWYERRKKNKKT